MAAGEIRDSGWAMAVAKEPIATNRRYDKSQAMLIRAELRIPLGTQTFSKSKTHFPHGASPSFLTHGQGGRVWDVDGSEYVDLVGALLPNIMGYRDSDVDESAPSSWADLSVDPAVLWDQHARGKRVNAAIEALAPSFRHIVAVESSQGSAADLKYNSPRNAKAVRSTVDAYLADRGAKLRPDLVVVDPPRAGLGDRVVRGLGHGLDEAAITAANKMRFKPALRNGQPVDSTAVVHVVFQLAY